MIYCIQEDICRFYANISPFNLRDLSILIFGIQGGPRINSTNTKG
jgi:hypothetical protein